MKEPLNVLFQDAFGVRGTQPQGSKVWYIPADPKGSFNRVAAHCFVGCVVTGRHFWGLGFGLG